MADVIALCVEQVADAIWYSFSFSFHTSLLHIEPGQQAWYCCYSSAHVHVIVEASYLLCRRLLQGYHLLPHRAKVAYQLWG